MTSATTEELRSSALLRLLALAFAPPSEASRDAIEDLAIALEDASPEVDLPLLIEALDATPPADQMAAYERLFGGHVALAPYESSYERDPFRQARVMADVAGFYAAFGAQTHGPVGERPDHVGTELEFLGLLAQNRVRALEDGEADTAERIREIEDSFITDHAGRWLPNFFRMVAAADEGGYYGALGLIGEQILGAELVARDITPETSPSAPAPRTAVEDDELTCAAGDEQVAPLAPPGS